MRMNALHPHRMTPSERLDGFADITAVGLMRLVMRQSSPLLPTSGQSLLELALPWSGRLVGHVRSKRADREERAG